MKELDCVKIVKLLREDRRFEATDKVRRMPQIGDFGVIVYSEESFCVVENVDDNGYTIWQADFLMEELEIYERNNR